ncbi:MAG: arylsulfatase [Candidatus Omnitrophica bacterium]|nr:arylsulfatase [Candidatus Omnitrophota bacterium]
MSLSLRHFIPWLLALILTASETPAAPATRPNIMIILADDMGFSDLGCYGSEIATPHLDGLAETGVRFTQFYNTARCCPSRASLLTGLYSHQAGVGHMIGDYGLPGYRGFLNENCVTLAEVLKGAGYRTLMTGKWHVGEKRPHWPLDRGFDRYLGLISGGSNYFRLDPERTMARDNESFRPDGIENFYLTDYFTDGAIAFLEDYKDEANPFFLYVAYTAPHWPLHAPQEDINKYRGKYLKGWDALREERRHRMIELGLLDPKWELTARDEAAPAWDQVEDKELSDLKMAVYAAQIDRMDQNIGRLLSKLQELGKRDNTLILFLADNGGCAEEINRGTPGAPPGSPDSFLSYGLPWANASNTPFRLYKHWVHEGGISTPLIASWPAVIREGRTTGEVGHVIDLMPTCADVAQAEYPKTHRGHEILPMEGKSLRAVLESGASLGERPIFWEHEGNRAVRVGKWKLVSKHPGAWQLFDLEADRSEMHNLADADPDRVARLAALYEDWAERCGARDWEELQEIRKAKRNP